MRRLISLLALLLLVRTIGGQTSRTITLDYNVDDFQLYTHNGLTVIGSDVHVVSYSMDTSTPALPLISIKFLIGPDEKVSRYDVSYTERLTYNNIDLPHNVPCCSTSEKATVHPFEIIKYDKSRYPDSLVQYYGVHSTQGYQYAELEVSPFTYKPEQKSLYINKISITLTIEKAKSKNVVGYRECPLIERMVVNSGDLATLYPNPITRQVRSSSTDGINNVPVDYVIVTCDSLKDAFQELANWKIQKGINTKVITVEDIYAQDTANDANYIQIKRALDSYYNNGQGCKFILLGGDVNVIPDVLCYVEYNRQNSPLVRYAVSDLYYACYNDSLDVRYTWDRDSDWVLGTIADNIDPTPCVSLGRIPILNRVNAANIIQRIINYEKGTYTYNWENNILMFGAGSPSEYFNYLPEQSMGHYYCDTLYSMLLNDTNWGRFRFYDTDSDYPTGELYELNADHLQAELARGYHFIYGNVHGFPDSWSLESGDYSNSHALSCNNPLYSHFITPACWTNKFNQDCLSKSFWRNPDSGILSYYGSSVEGWYDPFGGIVGSILVMKLYFSELINNSIDLSINYRKLGEVSRRVQDNLICDCNINTYNSPYRWLLFSMNLLGDPEMPVFISTPQQQEGITCDYSNGTLSIQSPYTPGEMADICIMSLNDNGATYYYRSSLAYNPTFSLPANGEYSVCITYPGAIAYVKYVGENAIHIQNRTLSGDSQITSRNVYFGRDVLPTKPQGPVAVIKGKTEVKATNSVLLKNSFEVLQGAEFSVEIEN